MKKALNRIFGILTYRPLLEGLGAGIGFLLAASCSTAPQVQSIVTAPDAVSVIGNTGYSDDRVSPARVINIDKLAQLEHGGFPFTSEQVFLSFAQPYGDSKTIQPVAMAIGKPKSQVDSDKLIGIVSYNRCAFRLQYMGSDENHFEYFQELGEPRNPEDCANNELLRVEHLKDKGLRVSGHDGLSGKEMWAGVFYGRPM